MSQSRRIVITGFMGAGKTTVARALAPLLQCAALDLDDLITEREGRTPRQLIDEEGEAFFRDAETRALAVALSSSDARVIATGGGAWTMKRNRTLVAARDCLSVWLDAPFELCWERIGCGGDARPFARDREKARRLYDERLAAYGLAKLRVRVTPELSVEEIAALIVAAVAPR
jgi:shikimate kinase